MSLPMKSKGPMCLFSQVMLLSVVDFFSSYISSILQLTRMVLSFSRQITNQMLPQSNQYGGIHVSWRRKPMIDTRQPSEQVHK